MTISISSFDVNASRVVNYAKRNNYAIQRLSMVVTNKGKYVPTGGTVKAMTANEIQSAVSASVLNASIAFYDSVSVYVIFEMIDEAGKVRSVDFRLTELLHAEKRKQLVTSFTK